MTRSLRLRTEYHKAHAALDGVSRRNYAAAAERTDLLERLAYRAWLGEQAMLASRVARVGGGL